jgi:hypothetical protein
MNIALLLKWIWKLYQGAEGLWADLLREKYLGERDLFAAETPTRGSQFWTALQKIKWYFKLGAKHHVENGGKTNFWFDWCPGSAPHKDRFPSLFDICTFPNITVRYAFQGEEWGIVFRRSFGLPEAVEWDNLTRELDGVRLTPEVDRVSWTLDPSGVFTTSSIYGKMSQGRRSPTLMRFGAPRSHLESESSSGSLSEEGYPVASRWPRGGVPLMGIVLYAVLPRTVTISSSLAL